MTADIYALAGGVAAALIALATALPKILNAYKRDKIDGDALDTFYKRLRAKEARIDEMDATIHQLAIERTELTVTVQELVSITTQLTGIIVDCGATVPAALLSQLSRISANLEKKAEKEAKEAKATKKEKDE